MIGPPGRSAEVSTRRMLALRDDVRGAIGEAGFGAGVGQRPEAECGDVKLRRLFRVADPQFEVIEAKAARRRRTESATGTA